jgi:hypothetical protein
MMVCAAELDEPQLVRSIRLRLVVLKQVGLVMVCCTWLSESPL